MNKKIIVLVLFAALGTALPATVNAQSINLPGIFTGSRGYEEGKIYQDSRGIYHYETRERRVWVPEQRTRGIFGSRVIPGHYEIIREQVKIYHRRNNGYDDYNRGRKSHPHGMPPGQRKKYGDRDWNDRDRYDDRRYSDRYYN